MMKLNTQQQEQEKGIIREKRQALLSQWWLTCMQYLEQQVIYKTYSEQDTEKN